MQSANQEPVELFHAGVGVRRLRLFFNGHFDGPHRRRLDAGQRFGGSAPEHVRFEGFETGRVSVVIEFVGIGSDVLLEPFLKQSFLLELAQSRFFTPVGPAPRLRVDGGGAGVAAARLHPLQCGVGIVKAAAHFHFHFVHERLALPNPRLRLPQLAQDRPELARSPAGEGRFVFAVKRMPESPQHIEPGPHLMAIVRDSAP
jgi:hypothetical protein